VIADGDGRLLIPAPALIAVGYGCGALVGRQIESCYPRRLSTAHPMIDEHWNARAASRWFFVFRSRSGATDSNRTSVLVMRVDTENISALGKAPSNHLLLIDASFANAKCVVKTLVSVSHGGYRLNGCRVVAMPLERLHRRENMPDAILIDIARPDDAS